MNTELSKVNMMNFALDKIYGGKKMATFNVDNVNVDLVTAQLTHNYALPVKVYNMDDQGKGTPTHCIRCGTELNLEVEGICREDGNYRCDLCAEEGF